MVKATSGAFSDEKKNFFSRAFELCLKQTFFIIIDSIVIKNWLKFERFASVGAAFHLGYYIFSDTSVMLYLIPLEGTCRSQ